MDGGGEPDSSARKEADFLNRKLEPLTDWAAENKIRRDEFLRHCFFYGVSVLIVLAVILFAATLCIWVWHLIGPHDYRWLTPTELEKVQVLVFSGAASSLATVLGKRVLGSDNR
jgi:hypothetical protein